MSKYIQYHSHGFSYHSYADDTQHILSYPQFETQETAQTCVLPTSQWLSAHHLKLGLNMTKSSFFQGRHLSPMTFLLLLRTLWCPKIQVTWVWHWMNSCATLPKTTCSCRFILHYIRRICPFLTQEVVQDLVQVLVISRLNYGNSLLAGVPMCHRISAAHLQCWSSPISSTIYHFSAPCIGYQWLLQSDSRQNYLPTVLQMVQVHPTWRRWSNHTPQPVCYCQSAWYFLTMKRAQLPLNKIKIVCCPGLHYGGTSSQHSRKPINLPSQTENSPWPIKIKML